MKIVFGDIVGKASGSLRSNTFSRNRYGVYVRNRATPVNPQTARQTTVRTLMQQLTSLWLTTLTEVQRDQWRSYAANVAFQDTFGNNIFFTGLNHYVRSNVPRLVAGLTRVDNGPIIFNLPATDETAIAAYTADDQMVAVTYDDTLGWADEDGAAMLVYTGIPVNPTIDFFNGPFRFADSIDGDGVTPPTSPTEVASPFVFQEGQRVYSRFRLTLNDGRLSGFFRLGADIVAAT